MPRINPLEVPSFNRHQMSVDAEEPSRLPDRPPVREPQDTGERGKSMLLPLFNTVSHWTGGTAVVDKMLM